MCHIRNGLIRLFQIITGRLDPDGIDVFQRTHLHVGRKDPSQMGFTDVTVFCQLIDPKILHVMIGNIILEFGDHIHDFSSSLTVALFPRIPVDPCNLHKKRCQDPLGFFQIKLFSIPHDI